MFKVNDIVSTQAIKAQWIGRRVRYCREYVPEFIITKIERNGRSIYYRGYDLHEMALYRVWGNDCQATDYKANEWLKWWYSEER